ncbi:CLUMA_CG012232, isoform A [Clunio marinus]|uniref:CLUMA_CG012232, isoform A n=1 Tax=Clunio marinus TaxID=568069 RepID=A0A1J1IFN8_9DIPT|nr:CLUMA_CG012232, isoform A [Clunio marinus]
MKISNKIEFSKPIGQGKSSCLKLSIKSFKGAKPLEKNVDEKLLSKKTQTTKEKFKSTSASWREKLLVDEINISKILVQMGLKS